ncbi:Ribosomal RNA small subunit methyltransferase G [Gossypium arboreum]|uniref:Ribosomal RNA small subunit methyltransferase G n=1 Tax=Gossypium arboreum TaxID=29729 RepID=A0A0B0Q0I0_GOSAR|nr:Ribosomal RNA small subunit methyltransferase G [Gossypium arboreum]
MTMSQTSFYMYIISRCQRPKCGLTRKHIRLLGRRNLVDTFSEISYSIQ